LRLLNFVNDVIAPPYELAGLVNSMDGYTTVALHARSITPQLVVSEANYRTLCEALRSVPCARLRRNRSLRSKLLSGQACLTAVARRKTVVSLCEIVVARQRNDLFYEVSKADLSARLQWI